MIRALVQEAHWDEAKDELSKLAGVAPTRDVYFLEGFLERKRGNIDHAIHLFDMAEQAGRKGLAVKRELASCYFIKSDFRMASQQVDAIMKTDDDNPFIIDLWVQLATKMGDERKARERLVRMEAVDPSGFYYHRLSVVESRFGNLVKAREAAAKAVEMEEQPSFEMISQLALCEIRMGNQTRAEELLARLDNRFSKLKEEIRINLRCKLEIARKRYSNAIALSEKNPQKGDKFYKDVRRQALVGELQGAALDDKTRFKYKEELNTLEEELKAIDSQELESLY